MQFGGLGRSLRDWRRGVGDLRCGAEHFGLEHDRELGIASGGDLKGAVAILKSSFRSLHDPGATGDVLEIDDSSGLSAAGSDLKRRRFDLYLRIEDGGLLGVLYEDSEFAGLAGLGEQLSRSNKQQERNVTSRMS
jgi:hypothetical protein